MLKHVLRKAELNEKGYFLVNQKGHLYRATNSLFNRKHGYWAPPFKYLDGYQFSINKKKLNNKNCSRFILKPYGSKHYYDLKELKIGESVYMTDEENGFIVLLKISNLSKKEKSVNIALESDLFLGKEEKCIWSKDGVRNAVIVKAKNKELMLMIGVGKAKPAIEAKESFIKKGAINKKELKVKIASRRMFKIPFIFTFSNKSKRELLEHYDTLYNKWHTLVTKRSQKYRHISSEAHFEFTKSGVNTPNIAVNKAFSWSQVNLINNVHNSSFGRGIISEMTKNPKIEYRNVLWSLLGLIHIGEYENVRKILRYMCYLQQEKMPAVKNSAGVLYNASDLNPLFLIVLHEYLTATNDESFLEEMRGFVDRIINSLKVKRGLVEHPPEETAMDTLKRENAIEIQSLWAHALKLYNIKKHEEIAEKIDKDYWDAKRQYFIDTTNDSSVRVNALFPVLFNQVKPFKIEATLKRLKQEFKTKHGCRTTSCLNGSYLSGHDDKGSVSYITTALASCAFFDNDYTEEGVHFIETIASSFNKYALNAIPEKVDASDGSLVGAPFNTAASALFIYAIDKHLFGINSNERKKVLELSPKLIEKWSIYERFGKAVGNNVLHLKIKNSKHAEILAKFKNYPDFTCRLKMPSSVKRIMVNGSECNKNEVEFRPQQTNRIYAFYK